MPRKISLTQQDTEMWEYFLHDVTKIKQKTKIQTANHDQSPVKKVNHSHHSYNISATLPQNPIILGNKQDLSAAKARLINRGKHAIDARLDLHGLSVDQAHTQFAEFIEQNFWAQHRSLLVITGKGINNQSILNQQVIRWINTEAISSKIIRFTHAAPKDGGTGAFYIFLKRIR